MKVSILMPVYNERYLVAEVIRRVLEAPLPEGLERQLVIVDDGSRDGSREIVAEIAARYPGLIKFVPHVKNQGKGAALRTAIAEADGDFSLVQDADLEYDPNDYPRLLAPLLAGRADVVFGSRFLASERKRVLYYWHSVGNRFLTRLSNMLTNLDLTDMETCYKVFRTEVLKTIPIRSNGFGIEPEITAKVAKRGLRIYEVPISYDGRTYAEGKKINWRDGYRALATMLKFWLIDDIYDEKTGHAILANLSKAHRFNRWMADTIRTYLGDRVLEVGAGIGNLSTQLMPRLRYIATDFDDLHLDVLQNLASRRLGMEVRRLDAASWDDYQSFEGDIDTIVCLNVLEHIPESKATLDNMYRALPPGGRLIVLVPQGPWLYCPLDQALEHVKRYTPKTLRAALDDAGFAVEKTFHFNRIGVCGWLTSGKILRRKQLPKFQLKVYDSLVWLWRRIDWLLPWHGLSVIAVARKPEP
jgi:glycosyltransferase involved in cell wall biosynthesis